MKALVVVALVGLIHGTYATLLIKGPTEPLVEGQTAKLECRYADSELNISQVYFEEYSKYTETWVPAYRWERPWCRMDRYSWYSEVEWTSESVILTLPFVRRSGQVYRCVSKAENVTAPDNSSEPLALKVNYLGHLSLRSKGYSRYLGVPEELKVRAGEDVEVNCSASASEEPTYFWTKDGDDWILPFQTLTVKKVTKMDEGKYTCMASHPSVESLKQSRSFNIRVLREDAPWFQSSNGRLMLMAVAVAVSLLVFIASMSVFLCRRAKRTPTSKGPIDDRSQKKPIYKSSVESLPSTCGDKQPLV